MSILNKTKKIASYHLVDSTAILTVSTPVFSGFETLVVGLSPEESMNVRMIAAGSAYCGLGYLFGKGRDISRKIFGVADTTREKTQHLHDAAYTGAFNLAITPLFYLAAGNRNPAQIAVGTLCSMGFGAGMGGPMGYSVDLLRDLTGLKESERIPKVIKNKSRNVKKSLAALVLASTLAVTAGIYEVALKVPDKNPTIQNLK